MKNEAPASGIARRENGACQSDPFPVCYRWRSRDLHGYCPCIRSSSHTYGRGTLAAARRFVGKVVIVGQAGSIIHDELATPFGLMPGPEIHLNMINALLLTRFCARCLPWTGSTQPSP